MIGIAFIVVGVVSSAMGLSAGSGLAYTGPEQVPSTSESNDASYWGSGCSKLDEPGGRTWTADADYSIVVLKAAQIDWVYRDVRQGDVLTVGQQAISHFIFCPPATTTTTVAATTTTTVAATTTTVAETTTTVAATTTTVPETTTTIVDSGGPTTTVAEQTTTVAEQTTTTTRIASAGPTSTVATQLPATGSALHRSLSVLGALLISFGGVMLMMTRRSAAS